MRRYYKKEEINSEDFLCMRLRIDDENKSLLQGFHSLKNGALAQYLKKNAWREDETNHRAFYIVKEKNKIVLYFSLQCCLLVKCHKKSIGGIKHYSEGEIVEYYIDEDKIDVTKVIPGIELAHFCVNDSYRRKKTSWEITYGIQKYSVGEYVFYKFIAPKIMEVADAAGLQFVYLFCADDGSEKLINYYSDVLGFSIMDDMSCVRPEYDKTLCCMTMKLETLISRVNQFADMNKVYDVLEYVEKKGAISTHQATREFMIKEPVALFECIIKSELAQPATYSSNGLIVKIKKK